MATIKLKDYLKSQHRSYISHKIDRESFIEYLRNLDIAYTKIKDAAKNNATEENIKNIFADFLKDTFYKNIDNVEINTFDNIDYAIKKDGNIEVIMEFKKPSNKAEMITVNPKTNTYNFNKKALHEAIKYFYDEKYKGNYHIKNIIISDGISFFIFNAAQFQNKNLEKLCYDAINGDLYLQNTKDIYQAIHDEIERAKINFDYAWFDLTYLEKRIKNFDLNNVDVNDKVIRTLLYVYKLLHPDFLLNQYSPKDSNQLNKKFYDELLYILGLEEVSEGSKRLIQPSSDTQGLINETIYQLKEQKNLFNREETIGIAFELVITWLNRILFLKLFEAQLVAFNNDKNFKFITSDKVSSFDDLNHLFFAVLGKKHQERQNQEQTQQIPYLNSSLFELSDMEAKYFNITALYDKTKLAILKSSCLKKWPEYKNKSEEKILKYLLDFLDSYDFSSEANNNLITEENKDIINSAVLGLIFEKLNGYKDGSFYTPGFITEYMAKESIERAIVTKFNEILGIDAANISEVKNFIGKVYKTEDFIKYNDIVNSLKILDPAVGSGHFLVSVLNHIIYIKSYLGILWDGKEKIENVIDIFDDTLIVFTENDTPFVYKKADTSTHNLQKTLFNEKKTIIENCLFAVDINPKSVYICQLRLWIELLKNTYYIDNSYEMDVLPNIDINIKVGNSLISKFPIHIGKSAISDNKKLKEDIKDYKNAVLDYKCSGDKQTKQKVKNKITEIKRQLVSAAQYDMFSDNKKLIDENLYKNSMEWMIEFPEVLNENGEFQGFDVVIGNPPYIDSEAMVKFYPLEREYYSNNFPMAKGNWDIYIPFFNLALMLLKAEGYFSYISPDKWLNKDFGIELRRQLLYNFYKIIKVGRNVFDSATIDSILTFVSKKENALISFQIFNETENIVDTNSIKKPYCLDFLFSKHLNLLSKIEQFDILSSVFSIKTENACATSDAYLLKNVLENFDGDNTEEFFLLINTGTIDKYVNKWGKKEATYLKSKYLRPVVRKKYFDETFKNSYNIKTKSKKLIIKGLNLLDVCLDSIGNIIPGKSTIIIANENIDTLKVIMAFLNSKLPLFYIKEKNVANSYCGGINFTKEMFDSLPIPNISMVVKNDVIENVNQIIKLKHNDNYEQNANAQSEVKTLEEKINQIVYKLYGLTDDEIEIVEKSCK